MLGKLCLAVHLAQHTWRPALETTTAEHWPQCPQHSMHLASTSATSRVMYSAKINAFRLHLDAPGSLSRRHSHLAAIVTWQRPRSCKDYRRHLDAHDSVYRFDSSSR